MSLKLTMLIATELVSLLSGSWPSSFLWWTIIVPVYYWRVSMLTSRLSTIPANNHNTTKFPAPSIAKMYKLMLLYFSHVIGHSDSTKLCKQVVPPKSFRRWLTVQERREIYFLWTKPFFVFHMNLSYFPNWNSKTFKWNSQKRENGSLVDLLTGRKHGNEVKGHKYFSLFRGSQA